MIVEGALPSACAVTFLCPQSAMNCLMPRTALCLPTGGQLPLDGSSFCETSNDPLDPVRGTIVGRIQRLSAHVKLKLKQKSFTSTEAVNQLAPDGGIIWFSQHYAAKRRETPCQLGPHWGPVQFLVFFADPQGS